MASSSTNPYPNYPYPSEFNVSDYPYPSEFNVSDLVPDKLSKSNYSEWKPLMLDFIESQDMDRFIHHPPEESKLPDSYLSTRSDRLVRRWILSTLNKDIIKQVLHHKTAREVWKALETKFGPLKAQHDSLSYMEIDERLGNYMPLHINAIQGDIQSAIEFIHDEPDAIRMPISAEGETMLITAVRSVQRNKLVAYLLGKLSAGDLADQRDNLGRTALHVAAEVGNLEAAKMLVDHNCDLLIIEDEKKQTPLIYATKTANMEMVRFLLDRARARAEAEAEARARARAEAEDRSGAEAERLGFSETGRGPPTLLYLLYHLANSGLYDIALELLQENSMLECTDISTSTGSETCPLMAMSQKRSSFRSGTPLSSFQKFIYSIAPAKLRNNATTNPAVNENRQNPPAVTDTVNPVVDENPQSGAVNPAVNENRQNPPAVTDTENSIVDENPQSGAVNPVVNENQQNPLAVAENSIVNENTQNAAVNPAVNENRQNPPAVTDTENSVVDENLQSGAVNPVVNENQQNPLAVTEKSFDNQDVQNVAPVKLKNTATENPTEHRRGNTENSANRENPVENLQSPVDTENLANTENPVENLQNYTENPANRENSNHESRQNLPQNLVVNENSHNDAVNPFVDEKQQNLPAITDTENSVVDENPQNVAVNPIVNENRQNLLAIADNSMVNENLRNPPAVTDTENSVVAEDPQNVAVNPVVNENRQNPLAITDNSIVNENLQNTAVNPVVNENQRNPPAATDTENSVVDENPQYGAVTENPPIIENNLQNPVNIADSENPQNCTITENPIVNENPQIINENSQNLIVTNNSSVNENPQIRIDITEDSVVNENLQNLTVYETPHNDIDNPQNPVVFNQWVEEDLDTPIGCPTHFRVNANDNLVKIGNRWNLVVDGIGRWHATHWHLADQYVPAIKHIREIKLKHDEALELVKCLCKEIAKLDYSTVAWMFAPALEKATSSGIHEIVEEILRSYPDAIYFKNENNQSIFQSAIVWRRENVFNLIYQLKECSHKFLSVPDKFGNNALHLAGCLGPQHHLSVRVSAAVAALQMQRELQWFKEVEKFVLPEDKECRNDDGMTPAEVFTKTHKELAEAGERWMKETATSCTIVTALIATVMFAAAITVPGGNNASSGVPIFSKQKAFIIFGLSNALALFASITSLLMFLFILTAHYAEQDFLYSLPNRLIRGLVYLFLSISSTVTAFSATVYLMMGENRPWIIYPIVAFAYIPMHLCFSLLFPLLVVMYKSTYRPAIFGKQSDHMLF